MEIAIIEKYKEFKFQKKPMLFRFYIMEDKVQRGEITVDCYAKKIIVDMGRKISFKERIAIQKSIFYCFCLTSLNLEMNEIGANIESFKYVEKNSPKNYNSIIYELSRI